MRLFLSLILTVIVFGNIQAQNIAGVATYKTATKMPIELDSSEVNREQQAMIKQMLSSAMQKEFELTFTRSESIYKEVESLDKGQGMRFGGMLSMFGGGSGTLYKNLKESTFAEQKEFFSKLFLIKDSIPTFQWKLEKETKSIGKYTCHKATFKRVEERMSISREEGEIKDTAYSDTIELTAWYTLQVPVSNGPAKYGGLPGLIMELNDGQTTMLCTRVVLNPSDPVSIEAPEKGEEVSEEEFEIITIEKIKEMQKMYKNSGQGRGRGNGRMQIRIGG